MRDKISAMPLTAAQIYTFEGYTTAKQATDFLCGVGRSSYREIYFLWATAFRAAAS